MQKLNPSQHRGVSRGTQSTHRVASFLLAASPVCRSASAESVREHRTWNECNQQSRGASLGVST
jgi:hypothetical protein